MGILITTKIFIVVINIPKLDEDSKESLRDSFKKISKLINNYIQNGVTVNSLQNDTPEDLVALLKYNNEIVRDVYDFKSDSDLGLGVYNLYLDNM